MTFKTAKQTAMPFGKYKGKTLDSIAMTDEGLEYLDWLRGWLEEPDIAKKFKDLREAVKVYLEDPDIAKDLAELDSEDDWRTDT